MTVVHDPGAFGPATIVQQVIVTRFSIRAGIGGHRVLPREWIDERLALLERFLVPGVRAQTYRDFTWWLLCDITTEPDVADRLRALDPRVRLALVGPREEHAARRVDGDLVVTGFRYDHVLAPTTTVLLVTGVDSDDAIHPAFLQDVTDDLPLFFASGERWWLRVAGQGYQYDTRTGDLFAYTYPYAPFQTACYHVDRGQPLPRLAGNHRVTTLESPGFASFRRPAWIQVVHGGNVINRIRSGATVSEVDAVAREFRLDL